MINCLQLFRSSLDQILCCFFFFQAEDGIRDYKVTGVQTCALPISSYAGAAAAADDASIIFYNPAGMSLLPGGMQVSAGLALINLSAKFSDSGSTEIGRASCRERV